MKKIYSVKDILADCFLSLFEARNDQEAERMIYESSLDTKTMLNRYPDEYILCRICEFDEQIGQIVDAKLEVISNVLNIRYKFENKRNIEEGLVLPEEDDQ